ncbi:MAG TPA: hypothetical protein VGP19_04125 [Candidatus Acidoferrales bacterium]|jgi:hypothetical protein|nr:hypothetical protein [Candidatus Acidoferrales bacterium]
MNNQSIGVNDQEERSIPPPLFSAEKELSAFFAAVHQLFGAEQARKAAENWIQELEELDWSSEASVIDWRRVTIAAAARFAGRDKGPLSRH